MRNIILLIAVLLFSTSVMGQEEESVLSKKELRQLQKEQKKAEKERAESEMRELTALMIEYQRFVLEANYVSDRTGERIAVSNLLNFVAVDSNEVVLQLGTHFGIGLNGVGGVTVEGTVSNYKVQKREGRTGSSYAITFNVSSTAGRYDLTMNVTPLGNADVVVRGSTTSGQLRFSGELVPLSLSRVYKGSSYP